MKSQWWIFLLLAAMLHTGWLFSTECYVDGTAGDDAWDGLAATWDGAHGPKRTIQAGVNAASDGDQVTVADGTYRGAGNKEINFGGKAITLRSLSGPSVTIIDCEGAGRGFFFNSGETEASRVDGFTIRGGERTYGGAMCCELSSPFISNCIIAKNRAFGFGAGVYCSNANPRFANCTILGNSEAQQGGGVYAYASMPSFELCTIAGNAAQYGGGIYAGYHSDVVVTQSVIAGNIAEEGGALYCYWDSGATLTLSGIAGNSAIFNSGAIYTDGTLTIAGCLISDNSAGGRGGGIYFYGNNLTITYSTIVRNSAGEKGGGLYSEWGSPVITNTILWSNKPEQILAGERGSPELTYCDVEGGWAGEANINANPLFTKDFHLKKGSPCIDAGTDTGLFSCDMDGEARPQHGGFDIGADEVADQDGDGLQDWWEEKHFGSPTAADAAGDPDADGLSNIEEYEMHATNPKEKDSDADGRSDGMEAAAKTNPLHADNDLKTYYVNLNTGNDAYDGLASAWDGAHGPKKTIQAGIDAAVTNWDYTILVAAGTYAGKGNVELNFWRKAIKLMSADGPKTTIVDGGGAASGLNFRFGEAGDSIVDGFTIRNTLHGLSLWYSSPSVENCIISGSKGNGMRAIGGKPSVNRCTIGGTVKSDSPGAGIYCLGSGATISECDIARNGGDGVSIGGAGTLITLVRNCTIVGNGGWGVLCEGADARGNVSECHITGNGGGVASRMNGALDIRSCTIAGNAGKGLSFDQSDSSIADCVIQGNSGEGLALGTGKIAVTGCRITNNEGSGLCCTGDPIVANTLVASNRAARGAALYMILSSPTLTNCTIANNASSSEESIYSYRSSPTMTNLVIWGNTPRQFRLEESTLKVAHSDVEGGAGQPWFGGGCIDADPQFVAPALGDFHLGDDSPCVDSGSDTAANLGLNARTTRTDGQPDSGVVDMGYHYPAGWQKGERITAGPGEDFITVRWYVQPGKTYIIHFSTDLLNWGDGFNLGGGDSFSERISALPWRFYRVEER